MAEGQRPATRTPTAPRRLGPYRLLGKLGEGGLGLVYDAVRDDQEYQRRVAIKLLRFGLEGDLARERLRSERQILAELDHPNIAKLLDGASTPEGVPYLVMEHIEGEPIDAYCDERDLPIVDRLHLFLGVCDAVAYAHRKLVIHRDLKPSNILVRSDGVPKLLDFGIAKLLETEDAHQLEATPLDVRLMTPLYASPEQIRGAPITTATDIYSLGVLLYRLLVGVHPYPIERGSISEIARRICEYQPKAPSLLLRRAIGSTQVGAAGSGGSRFGGTKTERQRRRQLRGDLDNIVLKALSKEPERRYASIDQFAEDLRNYLERRPVRARKPTAPYRVGKFVARHREAVALGAAAAAAILGLALVHASRSRRLTGEIASVRRERDEARLLSRVLKDQLDALNQRRCAPVVIAESHPEAVPQSRRESSADLD